MNGDAARRLTPRFLALGVLIVLAVFLAVQVRYRPLALDDAFITYRYARNLATGAGFVYNPGRAVLGTSTPLYTLLLAALAVATGSLDFEGLSLAVNAVALALSLVVLARIVFRQTGNPSLALLSALLGTLSLRLLHVSARGMETPVFVLLVLLGIHLHDLGRHRWAGIAGALATLARPEGAVLVGVTFILLLASSRRRALEHAASAGIVLAPWVVFATVYFGSPIPHSVLAKRAAYAPVDNLLLFALDAASEWACGRPLIAAMVGKPLNAATPTDWLRLHPLAVPVLLLVAALTWGTAKQIRRGHWLTALFPLLVLAGYAATRPLPFEWYFAALVPFYAVALAHALAGARPRLAATLVGLLLVNQIVHHPFGRESRASQTAYLRAATWIARHFPERPSVFAENIGALGYAYPGPVIDSVGLVSPECLPYLPPAPEDYGSGAYPMSSRLILALRPPIILACAGCLPRALAENPDFAARYRVVHVIPDERATGTLLVLTSLAGP